MSKGFLYDTGDELITREDVNEVPDGSTASAGDVLSLDSNKKPKWSTPESGLPDTTSASAGDVLSLDEDKEPVWSTPSGGGASIDPVAILQLSPSLNRIYPKTLSLESMNFGQFLELVGDSEYVPILVAVSTKILCYDVVKVDSSAKRIYLHSWKAIDSNVMYVYSGGASIQVQDSDTYAANTPSEKYTMTPAT